MGLREEHPVGGWEHRGRRESEKEHSLSQAGPCGDSGGCGLTWGPQTCSAETETHMHLALLENMCTGFFCESPGCIYPLSSPQGPMPSEAVSPCRAVSATTATVTFDHALLCPQGIQARGGLAGSPEPGPCHGEGLRSLSSDGACILLGHLYF